MAAAWDGAARWYDRQLWLERSAIRTAVTLAEVSSADRVLDVGTGTGAILRELVRRGVRPASVLGIDRSRAMLDRVPQLPPGWRLERAAAARLPLPAASIELAFASFVLHVLGARGRGAALHELRRVLVADGRLVVVLPALPARRVSRAAYRSAVGALARRRPGLAATFAPVEIDRDVTAAGFRIVATARTRWGYPTRVLVLASVDGPVPADA